MNEPLIPCRFCQEAFQLQITTVDLKNPGRDLVKCRKCRGQAPRAYWNSTPPPAAMKWPEKRLSKIIDGQDEEGYSKSYCLGFNAAIDKCKELNAPNVEQSGYFTETPKFSSNAEKRRYEMQKTPKFTEACEHDFEYKNLLTICKKCGYCQETFGKYSKGSEKKESENYCAETVMVPDNKAPKNELVPLDETEVHKTLLQARKDWENDPHHMSGEMYQLSAEATAIFSKFGSSGKRSLSQYDLSVFLRKQPFLSHLQADLLAERVVKKFSTAEVSLETIEKALSSIPSTHFPISKMNGKHYYYMCKEDIAKAIKRELDGK